MQHRVWITGAVLSAVLCAGLCAGVARAGESDREYDDERSERRSGSGSVRVASGLKEALEIGAENAIGRLGRVDGYFRNPRIKIPLPKQLRPLERGFRVIGEGKKVDEFVLGMNRAAERAAPKALGIFADAIRKMSFDDARRILTGGDTAATEFFRTKTTASLTKAFAPVVEDAMDDVGVARQYERLVGRYESLPFGRSLAVNLDDYVVSMALDGLFRTVGEEERKIRKNPAARVTDLLKDVFGRL